MNCAVRTCTAAAYITTPLPLCQADALRVTSEAAAKALGTVQRQAEQGSAEDETATLVQLIDTQGWHAVDLNKAMAVLNRPKATAARRLAAARKKYAADITRRAHHSKP